MAILNWRSVQSFVIVAITGFGPSGHNPTQLPRVELSELDGPSTEGFLLSGEKRDLSKLARDRQEDLIQRKQIKYERWNYGIPKHEIANADVQPLVNWFTQQYPRARAKQVQAKSYGGFVLNLTWMITDKNYGFDRLFNFHVKINAGSMDLATLHKSGAEGAQKQEAMDAMFPPLSK
jgi:hypothetical protein